MQALHDGGGHDGVQVQAGADRAQVRGGPPHGQERQACRTINHLLLESERYFLQSYTFTVLFFF